MLFSHGNGKNTDDRIVTSVSLLRGAFVVTLNTLRVSYRNFISFLPTDEKVSYWSILPITSEYKRCSLE